MSLMCGIDIPCIDLAVTVHQPTIKEIAYMGEKEFFIALQCLCVDKNRFLQDRNLLRETNNFQIFMMIMNDEKTKEQRVPVQNLLSLMFPTYANVLFTPRSLILRGDTGNLTIDEQNFQFVQEIAKEIFCFKQTQSDGSFNPANQKAEEIARKIARGRKKVAEIKGLDNVSIFSQYLSILTVGLHIPLQNLVDLTVFQLFDLHERYQLYINWDIDIRARMAGAKPEEKPDSWMKNIH